MSTSNTNNERKILVTGAAGLVGNELVKQLLLAGEKVKAVYNKTAIQEIVHPNLELVQCDLLDVVRLEEVMQNITHVYHCAGLVNFSPGRRKDLFKANVEAVANIVNAALETGVEKLLHVSSVAALGRAGNTGLVNEKTDWNPDTKGSLYGYSKYLGEMEVWRGTAEGLNAVIVNPSVILGAGNWHEGSTAIFKKIYDGFSWYSEGSNGFVDVKDVAQAMILLMNTDISSERFIISANNLMYRDLFFMIADGFGTKRPDKKVNPLIGSLVWRLEKIRSWFTGKEPLVTKDTMTTALAEYRYDNSRLLNQLPSFHYTSMKSSIDQICKDLQQKINKG